MRSQQRRPSERSFWRGLSPALGASLFFHLALFAGSVFWLAPSPAPPVPLGVDIVYGVAASSSSQGLEAEVSSLSVSPVKESAPPLASLAPREDAILTKAESEAMSAETVVHGEHSVAEDSRLGSKFGFADHGALEGLAGRADGQRRVQAEERYIYELHRFLERRKVYPNVARRMGQEGRVMVRFTITEAGRFENIELLEGSSFEALNRAALDVVARAGAFRPLPGELNVASWQVELPFEFVIN